MRMTNYVNYVQSDLKDTKELSYKKSDLIGKANAIHANFRFVSFSVKKTLFTAQCCKFYGSQAWDLSRKSKLFNDFEIAWRKSARSIFCLPYRTHNYLVNLLLGQPSLSVQMKNRFTKMITSCNNSNNSHVKFLINYSSCENKVCF